MTGLLNILIHRIEVEPLNLWATLLFLGAVVHTFFTAKFHHIAGNLEKRHRKELLERGEEIPDDTVMACGKARLFHFLGEVEAVFGIWVVPLVLMLTATIGLKPALEYVEKGVNYDEALFVVVIMAISSTRPILRLAEQCLAVFARMGGTGPRHGGFPS